MSECDSTFDFKINIGHNDVYFSSVILPYILKTTPEPLYNMVRYKNDFEYNTDHGWMPNNYLKLLFIFYS